MNMRSLNSFAGGAARGIGFGSEMGNRKKLTDMESEKLGLLKSADARAERQSNEMTELIKKFAPELWKKLYGMPESPGETAGRFEGSAAAPQTTYSTQPVPDKQSFMSQQQTPFGVPRERTLPEGPFWDWIK
jgi:hypothetical protein